MAQNESSFLLAGGLDLVTPGIAKRAGTVLAGLNYEPVHGGYQRVQGFERFDGHPRPSEGADQADRAARRALITRVPGQGPVRGVAVFNGEVLAFRDKEGGESAGMYKSTPSGWSAVTMPMVTVEPPTPGPPSEGAKYLEVYFRSTTQFTVAVGSILLGASSGAGGMITQIIMPPTQAQAGTQTVWEAKVGLPSPEGVFTASEQVLIDDVATGLLQYATIKSGTIPPVDELPLPPTEPYVLPAGGRYEFVTHNFYGAADLKRIYGVNGVGSAFSFDGATFSPIPTNMPVDQPNKIAVHKQALVLGFPGGSTQISAVGNAESWDAVLGAVEIAIGDEITDYISWNGTLVILGRNGISLLYGSDETDFKLEPFSSEAGALPYTAELMGTPVYMDNRGVRSLNTTQAYGNFQIGAHSAVIQPLLDALKAGGIVPVGSCRVRSKDQYRLFFSNGFGLTFHLTGKGYTILPFNLGKTVTSICSVENADGEEEIYFGSTDGFVYQLDKGVDFDGGAIEYWLRLAYVHGGNPNLNKRWHRVQVDFGAPHRASLRMAADFDYGGPSIRPTSTTEALLTGGAGIWDESSWDSFTWDSPIEGRAESYVDGFGQNISVLFSGEAAGEPPHLLKSVTAFWTPRGQSR